MELLQAIWEPEFVTGSYGYRPNKSAHQAVHSLQMNLQYGSYGYIVEADIKGFFDNMSHDEAERFYRELPERLSKFNLEVAHEKTSMKRFSRFRPTQVAYFDFLGFRLYWDTDFKGEARVRRETSPKKHKTALAMFYQWIKENRHKRLDKLIPALNRKVQGFRNYFALSGNSRSVGRIFDHILESLYKWLNRRSQRKSFTWGGMKRMLNHFGFQSMRVRKPRVSVDWYYERAGALHGR